MARNKVKRSPSRGHYDEETVNRILDDNFICHVAIVHNGSPVVIPTMYGRDGKTILIHGATVSRLIQQSGAGTDLCLAVTKLNGLVLARSAYHHSANYESVVVFGKGELVKDTEKEAALKVISDHILRGRWEEVRPPSAKELKGTDVVRISMNEVSAKIRKGPPVDDKPDYNLDVWAGVLPVEQHWGSPVADPKLSAGIEESNSVKNLNR